MDPWGGGDWGPTEGDPWGGGDLGVRTGDRRRGDPWGGGDWGLGLGTDGGDPKTVVTVDRGDD